MARSQRERLLTARILLVAPTHAFLALSVRTKLVGKVSKGAIGPVTAICAKQPPRSQMFIGLWKRAVPG
jgi:hypothetical protein